MALLHEDGGSVGHSDVEQLPFGAKNSDKAPVERSACWTYSEMKPAPPTPTSLRRRILVKFGSAPPPDTSPTSPEPHENPPSDSTQVQSTFDKLQRLRFGNGGNSANKTAAKKRTGDKTEKLRELTDLLRGRPDRRKPPASPSTKFSKHSSLRSLFGSNTSLSGQSKDTAASSSKGCHKRASSVTSVTVDDTKKEIVPPADQSSPAVPCQMSEEPVVPPPRRPFSSRSSSFSQGDFNSPEGKLSWKRQNMSKGVTLPKKSDGGANLPAASTRAGDFVPLPPHIVPAPKQPHDNLCSPTPSDLSKLIGSRSLTYPISKKSMPSEKSIFSSIDGDGLKTLQTTSDLPPDSVKSEEDYVGPGSSGCLESVSVSTSLCPLQEVDSEVSVCSRTEGGDDDDERDMRANDARRRQSEDMLKPLEKLGREIDDMLGQDSSACSKPDIFVTTWSKGEQDETDERTSKKILSLNCDCRPCFEEEMNRSSGKSPEQTDIDCGSVNSGRWSGCTDYSQNRAECSSEPLSPEDSVLRPIWPTFSNPKLSCRSSDDNEMDMSASHDSFSDGENESLENVRENDDQLPVSSPSYYSDSENTKKPWHPPRRYFKRPLRGPYGEMLEAEMKKPDKVNKQDKLGFLEDVVSQPESIKKSPQSTSENAIAHHRSKRKISAYTAPPEKDMIVVSHQRTTSSPSQLGVRSSDIVSSTPISREPSQQLLAQLLRGSSEQEASPVLDDPKDLRSHVVSELVSTEQFYVESLKIIVQKYLNPLKSSECADLIDSSVVDEIFYQIPEILSHHESFLEQLQSRLDAWSSYQTVGDILLDIFTNQAVIDTYTTYISNWKKAKEAFKTACQQKPLFAKFIKSTAREHKGKLALDALIIMPVQRVPHYELLIQRLLKNTDDVHPDHELLESAHKEAHELAVKINASRTECLELEQQQQTLRELETLIDGLAHLPARHRLFIRCDTVTILSGQDSRKERAFFLFSDLLLITSVKRRTGPIRKPSTIWSGSLAGSLDANKYKLLMRIPLDELDIIKPKDEKVRSLVRELEQLSEDAATLSNMIDLAANLHCNHSGLGEILHDLLNNVQRQLAERQPGEAQLNRIDLSLGGQGGAENMSFLFPKPDKRASWEEAFFEAKQRLATESEHHILPELVAPVPIRKTRAGLQFTCAAPTLGLSDVWVCNSDGYVGQVCVLSLHPEPSVVSCNGVCNARILCIAAVPAPPSSDSTADVEDIGSDVELESCSSSSLSDEDEVPTEQTDSSGTASMDDSDASQPAMWLGTEDGNIHVYSCSDNIRVKKNKVKIQHGSSVQCIVYYENRVYAALANGDVTVYSRDRGGFWNTSEPISVSVGTAAASVTKMAAVNNRLWCGCHSVIKVLNIENLQLEKSFPISTDGSRVVSGIAVNGQAVWVSMQNSAVLRLFHANTFECLCDVNVAPAVTKMLSGCDDIIRQHKAACLRVTSLLACQDRVWVGTSAGVLLTVTQPHVSPSTSKLNRLPNVTGIPQGHTGHVRFLTCVEAAPRKKKDSSARVSCRHHHSVKSKSEKQRSAHEKLLVISGGDGYEDFTNTATAEAAGREDSTNHLLLWHV